MVEIDHNTNPVGPCKRIRESEGWSVVADMVEKTDETGKEYAIIIVEGDGHFEFGNPVEGVDEAIEVEHKMEAKKEAMSRIEDMNLGFENVKLHFIHTHPNGFAGQSLGDLVSIPYDIDSATKIDSHLVATEIGLKKVHLSGLYMDKEPTEDDIDYMKTQANAMRNFVEQGDVGYDTARRRLENEYDPWFGYCSIIGMI